MDAVIMTRLDEITKTIKELNTEYSIISKQILEIGVSDMPNSNRMGLWETKTLREIVEEIQFGVRRINAHILDERQENECAEKHKSMDELKTQNGNDKGIESFEESNTEYPVVEIERKTIVEERNWMKRKFNEMRKTKVAADGESLRGTTVEAISSSIRFSKQATCTMQLTNFLDSALTNLQYHFWDGSRSSGPSKVVGRHSEVISFVGDHFRGVCFFLCSFAISRTLRLAILCGSDFNDHISFGIGFTPAEIPTDQTLFNTLSAMSPVVPDVTMIKELLSDVPQELFVNHGNLLVRGQMTPGPQSVVCVEILEMELSFSSHGNKKRVVDGKSIKSNAFLRAAGNYRRFSCTIEIVNCLNVTLRNRSKFYCKCEKNNFLSFEVLPFHRERFFGVDNRNVNAMFSYEIDSTDLAIVVALKVGPNLNSFAAEFVQLPAVTRARGLKALMNPNQWKTCEYKKYATASEGVQLIRMGNIQAEIRMTEKEQSILTIRICAI